MKQTYFSKNRKVILDRETGQTIVTNNSIQPAEAFFHFTQNEFSALWEIKHPFLNLDYLIFIYVLQDDGTYKKVIANQILSNDNKTILVDFAGVAVKGFASIMFIENDITIQAITPSPTPSVTASPIPTPTPTPV